MWLRKIVEKNWDKYRDELFLSATQHCNLPEQPDDEQLVRDRFMEEAKNLVSALHYKHQVIEMNQTYHGERIAHKLAQLDNGDADADMSDDDALPLSQRYERMHSDTLSERIDNYGVFMPGSD